MGIERRLIVVSLVAGGLALSGSGCSEDQDALQRRQLLAAQARSKARQERVNQKRVLAPDGALLPSETKIAGIVLPRGFSEKFVQPHMWTYDSDLAPDKVQAYFEQRLTTTSIDRRQNGEIWYLGAKEKADPNMAAVVVKVMTTPSRPGGSRIFIGEPLPPKPELEEVTVDIVRSRLAREQQTAR